MWGGGCARWFCEEAWGRLWEGDPCGSWAQACSWRSAEPRPALLGTVALPLCSCVAGGADRCGLGVSP